MKHEPIYSTKQVAELLHVSKSTIYELIKRGELHSYKVGKNIRFSQEDIDNYIHHAHNSQEGFVKKQFARSELIFENAAPKQGIIICGQDIILDILSNYMRLNGIPTLRAYIGSFESLLALYQDEVQVASAHLWSYDLNEYNIPFVKHLLPSISTIIIHLVCRMQGFYVLKENPKHIVKWEDLKRDDITMINREKGSGSRVLLDGHLRLLNISGDEIRGYNNETSSHLTVASSIAQGKADVGIGTEKICQQVDGIEFIPMQKESYDLIIKKKLWDTNEIQTLLKIITSSEFQSKFSQIGGYDITDMGKIIAET